MNGMNQNAMGMGFSVPVSRQVPSTSTIPMNACNNFNSYNNGCNNNNINNSISFDNYSQSIMATNNTNHNINNNHVMHNYNYQAHSNVSNNINNNNNNQLINNNNNNNNGNNMNNNSSGNNKQYAPNSNQYGANVYSHFFDQIQVRNQNNQLIPINHFNNCNNDSVMQFKPYNKMELHRSIISQS